MGCDPYPHLAELCPQPMGGHRMAQHEALLESLPSLGLPVVIPERLLLLPGVASPMGTVFEVTRFDLDLSFSLVYVGNSVSLRKFSTGGEGSQGTSHLFMVSSMGDLAEATGDSACSSPVQ